MSAGMILHVNGRQHRVDAEPDTPLLYVLRNDLGLKGPKFGCGLEQCGACKVLINDEAVPSCRLPIEEVQDVPITTLEGLGMADDLHPLQKAFIDEQAIQCGYCAAGMIIGAQALLNGNPSPTDEEIRGAMADHLCRCGVYDRVRRAIKRCIGQREDSPVYEVQPAQSETTPRSPVKLPRSLVQTPELDAWVRINPDATVTLFTGKVELGQGLKTAIAQIGAEELDVSVSRIRIVTADSEQTPDEGITAGSMSLETTGRTLRWASAEARHHLLSIAHEELEAPLERLVVRDGTIVDMVSGRRTTYWELFGGQRFGIQVTGTVAPKMAQALSVVGRPVRRLDLPAKVTGQPAFIHDLDLWKMVHGRVVRPPRPGVRLVSLDVAVVARMPGVLKVVRDGSFLGVIAEREEQAISAMAALRERAIWEGGSPLSTAETLYTELFNQTDQPFLITDGTLTDEPVPPVATPPGAVHTLQATYRRPYQMHASLGPSAAVAMMRDDGLTLWVQTQGVFPPRATIAQVLGMEEEKIHVIHRDGSGCYGHNGADDAALDAALLARAFPGRPVSLKWMREDEHAWEPYAPAMTVEMQGSLDADGKVVDWNHDIWSPTHFGRPRPGTDGLSGLLAAWYLEEPFLPPAPAPARGSHSGSHRNADPLYDFTRRRIVKRFLPNSPFRTSSFRSLGAHANIFAIESFMDELANEIGVDPVAFRLRHLKDGRARAVLEAAVEKADWSRERGAQRGRGLALAQYKNRQTYTAVVVELSVDTESGRIHLERVVIAADAGQIINPDGLSNQLEGGVVQSASMTLLEQVKWDENGITSLDWEGYPILRFPDAPVIETVLLDRPNQPPVGAGEATQGPAPAAIANAIFDAAGIRLREIPFTPERVKQALSRLP